MRVLEELARVRTLLIVFALIFVFATIAAAMDPNRSTGASARVASEDLALAGAAYAAGSWLVLWIAHKICFYRRIESYESRDASSSSVTPSPRLHAQEVELLGLGFQPVGQLEYRWPWQKWKRTYVFTNPVERVNASLGIRSRATYASYWPDGSSLVTCPATANGAIDVPNSRILTATGPAKAVFRRHLQETDLFGRGRGGRLPTQSMVDVLAHESADVRHLRTVMRASYARLAPPLAMCVLTGALLILLLH